MSPNHFAGKALKFRGSEGFWGPGLSKGLDVAVVILVHRYADTVLGHRRRRTKQGPPIWPSKCIRLRLVRGFARPIGSLSEATRPEVSHDAEHNTPVE